MILKVPQGFLADNKTLQVISKEKLIAEERLKQLRKFQLLVKTYGDYTPFKGKKPGHFISDCPL